MPGALFTHALVCAVILILNPNPNSSSR